MARLAERGWTLQTGIEPEFFLLRRADGDGFAAGRRARPARQAVLRPARACRASATSCTQLAAGLRACGLDVFQIDHEDAHGQYELNFRHADALTSADHLMLFKLAAQALAERARHAVLDDAQAVRQPAGQRHALPCVAVGRRARRALVFDDCRRHVAGAHFIAGVLAHCAALCALAAPTVNSYKRLVVGESLSGTSWAPAYVAHGPNNRTALVRTLPGRFEWRLPDACANPYLATAGLIAAGLDGIDRRIDPGAACTDDLFELSLAEIARRGIARAAAEPGRGASTRWRRRGAARRARRDPAPPSS